MRQLVFIVLLFTSTAQASDKFWSKQRVAWTAAHAGAASYDVWTTRRGLANGFEEANPLMRPFVTRSTSGQIATVGISLLLDVGMSYLYHRNKRWRKLKVFFPITFTIGHTVIGAYNHGLVNGSR